MAKFLCMCDNITRISGEVLNSIEWLLISDVDFDNFHGAIHSEVLYKEMKSLLVCNQCKALWVFWEGYDKNPTLYVLGNQT